MRLTIWTAAPRCVLVLLVLLIAAPAGAQAQQSDSDPFFRGYQPSPHNCAGYGCGVIMFTFNRAASVIHHINGMATYGPPDCGRGPSNYSGMTYTIPGNVPVASDGRFSYHGPWTPAVASGAALRQATRTWTAAWTWMAPGG